MTRTLPAAEGGPEEAAEERKHLVPLRHVPASGEVGVIAERIRLRARILSETASFLSFVKVLLISALDVLLFRPLKLPRTWPQSARVLVRFQQMTLLADPHLISLYGEIFVRRIYFHDPSFSPKPGMTVLDVGANEGLFSVCCARQGCALTAVEPNPKSLQVLQQHSKLNAASLVGTIPCALGSEAGEVSFVQCVTGGGGSGSSHVIRVREHSEPKAIKVRQMTLDQLTADRSLKTVDLLKIDVEGSEVEVLRGGEYTLAHLTRRAVVECEAFLEPEVCDLMARAGLKQVDKFCCVLYFARESA